MKVKGSEVLLPTTHVGSYPRPVFMQGKVFGESVDAPEYPSFRMRELYRAAIALTMKDQEDIGLDIVTDGAQHYENETDYELAELFHTMPHHLEGYRPYGDRFVFGPYDMPIWKPTVVGPISWKRPIFKPVVEAVKDATDRPLKINVGVGPVLMALLSTDKHYGDLKSLSMDIATAYNAEFKDLEARGLEMVQFAEPLTVLFSALEPEGWIMDAINRCFEGLTSLYRVVHMCYGHEEGQSAVPADMHTAAKVFPWAFDINCDQIHIEMASKGPEDIAALKGFPADKDLGIGVIDVKDLRAEDPTVVAQRIREVTAVVDPAKVCVSTDCSIASVRRIVAQKKLRSLVEGTNIVRKELAG